MDTNKIFRILRKLRMYFYIYWNRFVFYSSKVRFGRNMRVHNKFYLLKASSATISIGDGFIFTSGEAFNPLCRNVRGCIFADQGASIRIGDNVGISSATLWSKESIIIGNDVKIGGGVF